MSKEHKKTSFTALALAEEGGHRERGYNYMTVVIGIVQ